MDRQIRGGIIRVSDTLMTELGISMKGMDVNFEGNIFALIKERFLLPENYTVTEIFSYPITSARDKGTWGIFVESPDLPVITSDKWPPVLTPIYTRNVDGQAQLVEIKVDCESLLVEGLSIAS